MGLFLMRNLSVNEIVYLNLVCFVFFTCRIYKLAGCTGVIVSADRYFITRHGEYKFNPNEITTAHIYARKQAVEAMMRNVPLVIVDNTNLQVKTNFNFT